MIERDALDLANLNWRHESQRDKALKWWREKELPGGLPGEGPFPLDPGNAKVVFQTMSVPGGQHIWSMKQDGTLPVRLTTNPLQVDEAPAWAPLEKEIYFARTENNVSRIYKMRFDGSNQQLFTTPPAGQWDTEPAVSPDGNTIAFQRFYQIWLINADKSNLRHLLNYSAQPQPAYVLDQHPTWKRDGTAIAFARQQAGVGQMIVSAELRTPPPAWNDVTVEVGDGDPLWPSWNPGSAIVYRSAADPNAINIRSHDPSSPGPDLILSHPGVDQVDLWPSNTYDGQVVFQRVGYSQLPDKNKYVSHIYIVRADGTGGEDDLTALRIARNPGTPQEVSDWTPNWTY